MKRLLMMLLALCILSGGSAFGVTFPVEHKHSWGNCKGTQVFADTEVQYAADDKEHARIWKYEDVQQLEIAPGRISILTYNRSKIKLGADQTFNFKVLSGSLDDTFRKDMERKLSRPLVSRIVPEMKARFSIPARHRLFLSGSQGILEFGDQYIVYRSAAQKDSRVWRYDELMSVGSTGPFQLRIGALQKTGGEYGEEKNYMFDLKRRLQPEEYDFIWEKINRDKAAGQ